MRVIDLGSDVNRRERRSSNSLQFRASIASDRRIPCIANRHHNLNINTIPSCCYENAETNCNKFGRQRKVKAGACRRMKGGANWRSTMVGFTRPTRVRGALCRRHCGFNAVLRGSRADDGKYARWNAHGFYWTASESDPDATWFYNFGQGAKSLNRHSDGNKQMAISVR